MKLEKNLVLGLTASILVLFVQNQIAFADQNVTIKEDSSTSNCKTSDSCFFPSKIIVYEGQTVTWYNADSVAHSITSSSQSYGSSRVVNSDLIMPEESYSHRFNDSLYFSYYCAVHPWMQGLVIVEEK